MRIRSRRASNEVGFSGAQVGVFNVTYLAGQVTASALTTVAPVIGTLVAFPLLHRLEARILSLAFHVSTAGGAGSVARVGLYRAISLNDIRPGPLVADGGEKVTTSSGFKSTTLNPTIPLIPNFLYWLAYLAGVAAPTLRALNAASLYPIFGADSGGGTNLHVGRSATQAYGVLPDPFPVTQSHIVPTAAQPALYYRLTT